jgi:hypothetical protein
VPARKHYTIRDNGLLLPWFGLVWLNPPFAGRRGHLVWLKKFFAHPGGGCLVNSLTSADWWHSVVVPNAQVVLFPRGKTKFIKPDGTIGAQPANGIALLGVGDVANAALLHSDLGACYEPARQANGASFLPSVTFSARAPAEAQLGLIEQTVILETRRQTMNNVVQTQQHEYDDGFSEPVTRRVRCSWDDVKGWRDQDGLPMPSPLIVMGIGKLLKRFHPEYDEIRTRPLPDSDVLNAAIPMPEWRIYNDKPDPPWKLFYEIVMLDPATGNVYIHANSTYGARDNYDLLHGAVQSTRIVRGVRVYPIVALERRPNGRKERPHTQIIDWREAPNNDPRLLAAPSTPQLAAPTPAITAEAATATPSTPVETPAPAATKTLDVMKPMKPISIEEFIDDAVPY